ncbi:MAG: sulfoxide reductase heme-binding subunit YedZ [Methylovulum sp.]|uniref:sulfite oxidase heme-binding subunit YedZ n=1 Tax=Methylovulum sp. TaxID=1916980 RepID=UPI00261BF5FF|nr:protein-methionine-sulfoxide reductase heme-binding subunit MsrQ [Methylovulum sp.]MDD2724430.1 sulfoxide reductase heme-binding subunit YedZ [Methylovulum sp.]MDD5123691.1 sulfoxide reductase heme-binding subunit YedZ [Methylovulum sp.]
MIAIKKLDDKTLSRVKTIIFLLALIPFVRLIIGGITDGLGANPIEKITRSTGYWTLTLIMVTLGITPLRKLTGWNWLTRTRRMLGLSAFFYASLHFLTYLVLDQFFDWNGIVKDIIKRPYITVGFPSFLLLLPLAITSNNALIKKLGGKRWRCLHRLVYVVGVGGVVHYWWLVKKDLTNPMTFAVVLAVLLGFRVFYWWRGRQAKS